MQLRTVVVVGSCRSSEVSIDVCGLAFGPCRASTMLLPFGCSEPLIEPPNRSQIEEMVPSAGCGYRCKHEMLRTVQKGCGASAALTPLQIKPPSAHFVTHHRRGTATPPVPG